MANFHLEVPPGVVLAVLVFALIGLWRTICCCRRDEPLPPIVKVEGCQVPVEQLIQMKDPRTAYLLFFGAGLVGAHHFYLDRLLHGASAALTGNFLGFGWFMDLFCIPYYTSAFNRSAAPGAPPDRSCSRLCCCLPVVGLAMTATLFTVVLGLPSALQSTGLMDLEQRMAGTAGNPYVILEVDRFASPEDLHKAYDLQLRDAESSKDCKADKSSKACRMKKKHLKKALDFALKKHGIGGSKADARRSKKRKSKLTEDDTDQWFEDRREQWDAMWAEIKEGTARLWSDDKASNEEL